MTYGQASLPVREELAAGTTLTSAIGYGLAYSTLDNNKLPTSGVYFSFGQDFAGLGGDVSYIKSVADFRAYYEVVSDLISILHLQAGDMIGLNKCPTGECASTDGYVRMLDDFKMGPNLVRGFQPAGFGPRDITPGTSNDNIGGTMYWGASLEFQYPFYFLPKDYRLQGRRLRRFRVGMGLQGRDSISRNRRNQRHCCSCTALGHAFRLPVRHAIRRQCERTCIGRREHHLGFAVRPAAV